MKLRDELSKLIRDRQTWVITISAFSLSAFFLLLLRVQGNTDHLISIAAGIFLLIYLSLVSVYVLLAEQKVDILNQVKLAGQERRTKKYPSLRSYAIGTLVLSTMVSFIFSFVPPFNYPLIDLVSGTPSPTLTPTHTQTLTPSPTIELTPTATPMAHGIYYMIVLDASLKMKESFDGQSKWDAALTAVNVILAALQPDANYGLIAIGGAANAGSTNPCAEPSMAMPFSTQRAVSERVAQLEPGGGGSIYNAFVLAKKQFDNLPETTVRTLIFITGSEDACDGQDEWSALERYLQLDRTAGLDIYSEIIIIDNQNGLQSQTIADRISSLSDKVNAQAPQTTIQLVITNNTIIDIVTVKRRFVALKNPNVSNPEALGELKYSAPLAIHPGEGAKIKLDIKVADGLLKINPDQTVQVTPISEVNNCEKNIAVSSEMRAELDSLAFEIQSDFPEKQKVNILNSDDVTHWQWSILPIKEGFQIITLRVYWNNDQSPFWVCDLGIYIGSSTVTPSTTPSATLTYTPSVTPAPTLTATFTQVPTPTPWYKPVGENITKNSTSVILWLLGSIGALIAAVYAAFIKYQSRKDTIRDRKEKLEKLKAKKEDTLLIDEIQKRNEDIAILEAEIKKLELIKWWQVWK